MGGPGSGGKPKPVMCLDCIEMQVKYGSKAKCLLCDYIRTNRQRVYMRQYRERNQAPDDPAAAPRAAALTNHESRITNHL